MNHAVLLRAVVGVEVYEYLVVPLSEVLLGYSGMEITWTGQRFLCPLSNTAATLSVPGRRGGWICMAPAFMLKTSLERCERANALIYYKKMPNAWQQNKENPSPSLSVSTGVVCVCVYWSCPCPCCPSAGTSPSQLITILGLCCACQQRLRDVVQIRQLEQRLLRSYKSLVSFQD